MRFVTLIFSDTVVNMYTTCFNINTLFFLPTKCVYMICVDLRTNSDYLTVQH